jgi:hypothetical protein
MACSSMILNVQKSISRKRNFDQKDSLRYDWSIDGRDTEITTFEVTYCKIPRYRIQRHAVITV